MGRYGEIYGKSRMNAVPGEIWGDIGEIWEICGDMGRYRGEIWEIWGDMRRYRGEIWEEQDVRRAC